MATPVEESNVGASKLSAPSSTAVLQAFLVVGLWSATPPLAKIVMVYLPPLEFLGIRYSVAFLALLPIILRRTLPILRKLSRVSWFKLVLMGILAYPVANGLQFWALTRLSATAGTFTMNFVPLFALFLGIVWLAEWPTRRQSVGIVVALAGALIFFGLQLEFSDAISVGASSLGSFALAINAVLARGLARTGEIDSVSLTAIPLATGGIILLVLASPSRVPPLPIIGAVLFLAIVSGALAYTIWNHAIKRLQAFEITLIGNMMPMGTAVLAPIILGEVVTGQMWIGLIVSLVGVLLVTLRPQASAWAAG